MKLIIFTGAPASGKSSIAENVGKRLGIQVISKDGFKIDLFEKYGFTNHAEKKKLSILGEKQMCECMERHMLDNKDIIVDNNFKDFNEVRKALIKVKSEVKVICIYCFANYSILAERYNTRISSGNRHLSLYTLNQYPVIEGVSEFHKLIDAGDVQRIEQDIKEYTFGSNILEIDTNKIEQDYDNLCNSAVEYINSI